MIANSSRYFSRRFLKLLYTAKIFKSNIHNLKRFQSKRGRVEAIVYKKTDEWQRVVQRVVQQMTTSGTTSDNEWYNEWLRMTTSDNKWQWVTTSDNESQRAIKSDNEWQRMTASDKTN